MNRFQISLMCRLFLVMAILSSVSCVTKKKKNDIGWFKKAYHNTTAKYNGYYNANVILEESFVSLEDQHADNYNKLLEMYPYIAADNPKAVASELDRAIEKVSIVAINHEPSHWVDDCYVLMAKAQFLKQDYETAEETLQYFEQEFDPGNPQSRVYNKTTKKQDSRDQKRQETLERKKQQRADKKRKEKEREIEQNRKEEERKAKAKQVEEERKLLSEEKEEEQKLRKQRAEQDRKDKEAVKNERDSFNKQERDIKEKYNKRQADLKNDLTKLKKNLAKAQQERRENERKAREERRKNKKRDKIVSPNADPRSAEEVNLESRLESKEKEIEDSKTSYTSALADLKSREEEAAKNRTAAKSAKQLALEEERKQKAEKRRQRAEAKRIAKEEAIKRDAEEELLAAAEAAQIGDDDEEPAEEDPSPSPSSKQNVQKVDDGGILGHRTVYSEGLLWLAKTYIERQNFGSAEYTLSKLSSMAVTKDVSRQIPAVSAYLHLKKESYNEAIPHLEQAIEISKDNTEKARFAYILAQIYQMNGDAVAAKQSFEQVTKFKPNYDLEFNTKLSIARNAWRTGSGSVESVIRSLDKMEGEEKNADYLDQIYFTKGEIKLASGDKAGALEDFKESTALSTGNKVQKAESYYNLAQLFYEIKDYVSAQHYYDSTSQVLPQKDERFPEVKSRAQSLKSIAKNIVTIEKSDSLLALAALPEEELRAWAEDQLEELRDAEEEANYAAEEQPVKNNNKPLLGVGKNSRSSNFFAYNPITLDKGKRDFERKWGIRKLEDDWRRSSKSSSLIDDETSEEREQEDIIESDDEAISEFLKDVPKSAAQKNATNAKIEKSLFELGKLFRSEVQDYKESINSLSRLLKEYPNTKHKLDAYYYLYLDYLDLNDNTNAQSYADKIVSEFPESDFAMAISNPNYAQEKAKEENKKEQHYLATYSVFQQGEYQEVMQRIEKANELYGKKNEFTAKYDLLKAMSIGGLEGKDKYLTALNDVISKHPNTDEQTRAKEIVRFLKGDLDAFDNRIYDEAIEDFKIEDEKLHYVILATHDNENNLVNEAKIKISSFNKKYHNLDNLKITDIYLNQESKSKIILIRRFKNKAKAMDYIDGINKNPNDFVDGSKLAYDIFAITQRNYREVIKQKSINNYREFYSQKY